MDDERPSKAAYRASYHATLSAKTDPWEAIDLRYAPAGWDNNRSEAMRSLQGQHSVIVGLASEARIAGDIRLVDPLVG